MNAERVRQNAAASTRGTIYQLCVAVEKCYELEEGQRLLIEELGDVTIEAVEQSEVKHYADKLTDGHPNLWNTLRNWMDDRFDHTSYRSLILHTTQEFGTTATITKWNELDSSKRLKLLQAISRRFEAEYEKEKLSDPKKKASPVLKHQRFLLASQRKLRLKGLLAKIWIEAGSQTLPDLYETIKSVRIRGVLAGKKNDFLNSLIGYVCRADMKAGSQWVITYEDFEKKLIELTGQFRVETRTFPSTHYHEVAASEQDSNREDLFVQKIREIQYPAVIPEAIHHYEASLSTLNSEFAEYRIEESRIVGYSDSVVQRFKRMHSQACRRSSEVLSDSQNFYDETVSTPAPDFSGFDDSPDWFRNGLLHQRMNEPQSRFTWRVSKDE